MNNRDEVKSRFLQLIHPYIREAQVTSIDEDTHLIQDLKVNSARMVDIILESEDCFGISIDDASADRLQTVGDAIDMIAAKSAAKSMASQAAH